MKGLRFFTKTSDPRCWDLASYHSPHSLTWRWVLSFSLFRDGERKVWPLWFPYRNNHGLQWVLRIPWLGLLRFAQQQPMWFRDLYLRMRDEQDGLTTTAGQKPAAREANLGVIDGGKSVH